MRRLFASAVAVAALTAGEAGAQPRPVWSKDLTDKKSTAPVAVGQVGYAPDGRTLLAQTLSPRPKSIELYDARLWGFEAGDGRELFQDAAGVPTASPQQYPFFGFTSGDRVLTALHFSVTLRDARSGRVVSASKRPRQGHGWTGVWTTKERGYYLLSDGHGHDTESLYGGTLPAGPDDAAGWREAGPTVVAVPEAPRGRIQTMSLAAAAVRPDGAYLAAYLAAPVGQKGALIGYGLKTDVGLELVPAGRVEVPHHVTRLRFSPDGRVLASGDVGGKVRLWDVADKAAGWKEQAAVGGQDRMVSGIAFRPDGKVLAFTTGEETKANVWLADVSTGKVVGSFRAGGLVATVAFSPDGRRLATGNHEGRLDVWDVEQVPAAPKR